MKMVQGISVTGLVTLLISPFFFPTILYGMPQIPDPESPDNPEKGIALPEQRKERQAKVAFEQDYMKNIEHMVNCCMNEQRPYLQSECNIYSFSKLIDVPTHHLNYYFREFSELRFNDFRNKYRVEHAKSLIQQGKANEITLEAIGMLSGFASRNAFIACFKKFEGVSPGSFASRFN